MSLSIGIVGLPNVGKSTLFTALTNKGGLAANYPFATIEPNVGVVPVPDARLDALANIDHPTRIVPATIEFVDIAGLVAGASQGEGLGNQFLANIRETDAICEVVRFFGDPDVVHVSGKVDPQSDVETIKTELILADMGTLEKALPRLEKEAKRDKAGAAKVAAAKKVYEGLNEGHRARTLDLTDDELAKVHVRSMIGGRATPGVPERLFSFLFPESPGALAHFLEVLGTRWNITLFHYRTDGADYGRILCAFAAGLDDVELTEHMDRLGYSYNEETTDPAFRFFLAR